MTDDGRPDQLDVQVAIAMNAIRRDANEARHRLGLPPRDYRPITAGDWFIFTGEFHDA